MTDEFQVVREALHKRQLGYVTDDQEARAALASIEARIAELQRERDEWKVTAERRKEYVGGTAARATRAELKLRAIQEVASDSRFSNEYVGNVVRAALCSEAKP